MEENADDIGDDVIVSMEMTGKYENILSKLADREANDDHVRQLVADANRILVTIDSIGGGTRSAIAENLPPEMAVDYDAEAVVGVLQVLERYDLVVLEGNTWYPGESGQGPE